jgi:hypothetical protein
MAAAGGDPSARNIAAFWAWWATAREALVEAIEDRQPEERFTELNRKLSQLHPELGVSIHPGLQATHALSITGSTEESDACARRILDAAPECDQDWEYSDLTLPLADPTAMTCLVNGREIEMTGMLATTRHYPDLGAIVVELFHPLLEDLAWEYAEEVLHGTMTAVLGHAPPTSIRVIVTRAETAPEEGMDLGELRLYLDQLDS